MVLVVIAHVQGNAIEWPVVAIRFLRAVRQKVLLNPARTQRVQANGKHERQHQIRQRGRADVYEHGHVEAQLYQPIDHDPPVDHRNLAQPRHAGDLKDRKGQQPEGFPDRVAVDQSRFPDAGEIGIQFVDPLIAVVLQVIPLERDGRGKRLREIGHNGGREIRPRAGKDEIVSTLVHHHEQRVVGHRTHGVRHQQHKPPRRAAKRHGERHGERHLQRHDGHENNERARVAPDQGAHLWVRSQNGLGAGLMRFGIVGAGKRAGAAHAEGPGVGSHE